METSESEHIIVFRRRGYHGPRQRFSMLQEYIMSPLVGMVLLYAIMLLFLMSQHKSVLWPGLIGGFLCLILANFLGTTRARASFLEAGFAGEFFYMRSAYDVAYEENLKMYPIAYANATREGTVIHLNYIDRPVRLRLEDWGDAWHEIWLKLNGY